jgi:hypothetical protein
MIVNDQYPRIGHRCSPLLFLQAMLVQLQHLVQAARQVEISQSAMPCFMLKGGVISALASPEFRV